MVGRRVQVLWQGTSKEATGTYQWNSSQPAIQPGMYLLRLVQGKQQQIIKVIKK
jgi:hypothetical protein